MGLTVVVGDTLLQVLWPRVSAQRSKKRKEKKRKEKEWHG
jgi:hypothetical protein